MKILKSLALSLFLTLTVSSLAFAAITQVDASGAGYVRTIITATDTTNAMGDNCLALQGYVWKSVIADEVSGTAVWDIGFSNDFKSNYAVLVSGEAADNSYEMTTAMTHLCIHVTTCSTCVLKIMLYGQNER